VIFDPHGESAVSEDSFNDGTGPSAFAGHPLRGRIRSVVLKGRQIVEDSQLVDQRRGGCYLPAATLLSAAVTSATGSTKR
jgi:hypothetical protein